MLSAGPACGHLSGRHHERNRTTKLVPGTQRMTHILGSRQGDIDKGLLEQGRHHLGLEGCFRVIQSERRKERGNFPGGRSLQEQALGYGVNQEIGHMWKGFWRRLESPTGWTD